jgi:hypothetical protein
VAMWLFGEYEGSSYWQCVRRLADQLLHQSVHLSDWTINVSPKSGPETPCNDGARDAGPEEAPAEDWRVRFNRRKKELSLVVPRGRFVYRSRPARFSRHTRR